MNKESGFTLIEVVVSLVIAGIMAAIAGMGIVTATKGYIQTKENTHTVQKAHMAMTRIKRELMELTQIAAKDDVQPWVIFDNPTGRLAIAKVGDTVEMFFNMAPTATTLPGDGDLLVDNVQSFSISYFKGANNWQITDDMNLLSALQTNLVLTRNDGSGENITFSTMINPRNTNNFGGVPPTTAPYTAPQYDCFVATAAYGQPHHPMVVLLRQFRDRYLLTWTGGRIAVDAYYRWGPKLAAAIKDRPRAAAAARFLLLPAVGLAYLSLNCAAVLPAMLVLSWLLSHLILDFIGRKCRKRSPVILNARGNVLVGLVVIMLIFAALAAGMVSLTSTSTSNQVTANSTARAYYLAESGFRYAASEYLSTTDIDGDNELEDNRNVTLDGMHNVEFTLSNPDEKFRVRFYPFYYTTAFIHTAGTTNLLTTKFTGEKPAELTVPATGKLEIGSDIYDYTAYDDISGTFTLTANISETINDEMIVTPATSPSDDGTMTQNGNLALADASAFPERNGKFKLNGIKYGYVSRSGNTLENITDANDPGSSFSVAYDSSTDVVLEPFLKVISLGTVGQNELKATRQITYNVPLPGPPTEGERVEFFDPFDDKSAWNAATLGSQTVVDIGGENVLKVSGVSSGMGSTKSSLVSIDWSSTNVNFASAHKLAGNYLSYDTQVKVGFDSVPAPAFGFDSLGVPNFYGAGISVRLDVNQNFYGVSFLRGNNTVADDISDDLLPEKDLNLVVLWQQTGDGTTRKWLAYSEVGNIFYDDVETSTAAWTTNIAGDGRQWQRATNFFHTDKGAASGTSWTTSPGGSYVDGDNITLTSPAIDLSDASAAALSFWTRWRIYSFDDFGFVQISGNGLVGPWTTLNPDTTLTGDPADDAFTSNQDTFIQKVYDISGFVGNPDVRIRFLFDRDNDPLLDRDGWWVDDITIIRDFDIRKATLMLRLLEGATLQFSSGGTTAIEQGDTVTQSNGAEGTVVIAPIVQSGSWAGGDASGVLLLNNVSSTSFLTGNPINVSGKGNDLATVQGYKARDNYIQAYYGNETGNGTPDGNPYDQNRQPNSIGIANWPPDPGELLAAETDYYTLVQWNWDVDGSVSRLQDEDGKYTIIATDTLASPTGLFPGSRPELGLHATGDGVENVYYDDFAIQLEVQSGSGFLTPVQQ